MSVRFQNLVRFLSLRWIKGCLTIPSSFEGLEPPNRMLKWLILFLFIYVFIYFIIDFLVTWLRIGLFICSTGLKVALQSPHLFKDCNQPALPLPPLPTSIEPTLFWNSVFKLAGLQVDVTTPCVFFALHFRIKSRRM